MSKLGRGQTNIDFFSEFETLLKIYLNVVFKSTEKKFKKCGVQDGLVTPQNGLVTPPLWELRADLFKKRLKISKNASFSQFFNQGA